MAWKDKAGTMLDGVQGKALYFIIVGEFFVGHKLVGELFFHSLSLGVLLNGFALVGAMVLIPVPFLYFRKVLRSMNDGPVPVESAASDLSMIRKQVESTLWITYIAMYGIALVLSAPSLP